MKKMNAMGITIITVTHRMSEAAEADRIIVIEDGKVVMDAPPGEIFKHKQELEELHLDVPAVSQMPEAIHKQFPDFNKELIKEDELVSEVVRFKEYGGINTERSQ
jgi:ABC-type multidrug transport system ATPase subunit